MKKVLTWAGVAFLVYFVGYHPIPASKGTITIAGVIGDILWGFGTFVGNLFS